MTTYRTYTVHELVKDNKLEILKRTLDESEDGNKLLHELDAKGLHCIHIAAYVGEITMVNELIRRGTDEDMKRPDGMTPLLIAAMRGTSKHGELVISLAKAGADVNIKGPMGFTCMHFLCSKGQLEPLKALLEDKNIGLQINTRSQELNTPLHVAITNNNLEIALYLVSKGADKTVKNGSGKTPLECLRLRRVHPSLSLPQGESG